METWKHVEWDHQSPNPNERLQRMERIFMSILGGVCIDTSKLPGFDTQWTGWIERFGRLNLFVGPNNSGKSRLLRSLYGTVKSGLLTGNHYPAYFAHEQHTACESLKNVIEEGELSGANMAKVVSL